MSPSRFFSRLAPGAAQQPGAVRAAVLPRFAPPELETTVFVETTDEPAVTSGQSQRAPGRLDTRPRATISPTVVEAMTRPRAAQEPVAGAAVNDPAVVRSTPSVIVAPLASRREQPPRVAKEMTQPDVVDRETRTVHDTTIVERVEPLEKTAERTTRSEADVAAVLTVQGPLRPQTVAGRAMAPRVETPTVVEITIDRIDVRVPATNNVTQARPAVKRAEPTQSLGDYLRERGQGGA